MMLSIADVQFSYDSHSVLKDIHLELDRGQILAVLGVNGAGKSTFLKCINKILRVKGGTIRLHGDDVLLMKGEEIARHMGYVPQRYGEEELAVFDAVLLGRKPYMEVQMILGQVRRYPIVVALNGKPKATSCSTPGQTSVTTREKHVE